MALGKPSFKRKRNYEIRLHYDFGIRVQLFFEKFQIELGFLLEKIMSSEKILSEALRKLTKNRPKNKIGANSMLVI
jgi:hypothetical protein